MCGYFRSKSVEIFSLHIPLCSHLPGVDGLVITMLREGRGRVKPRPGSHGHGDMGERDANTNTNTLWSVVTNTGAGEEERTLALRLPSSGISCF